MNNQKPWRRAMKRSIVFLAALVILPETGVANDSSNVVYFVFAEGPPPRGRDSFVLPLTRSNDIEHVRSWLRATKIPPQIPITPLFWIERGADGINRDYLAVGAPQWSWHVAEFIEFAEGVVGGAVSTPTFVESDLDRWMAQSSGLTAFFHLPLFELLSRPIPIVSANLTPAGLDLRWTDLGVHYVYTVETAPFVDAPNWTPAPGGAWPTAATNWVNSATVTNQSHFYRVKAELKNP